MSSITSVGSGAATFNSRDWLSGDTYDANGNTLTSPITVYGSPLSTPDIYDFEDRLIVRHKPDGSSVNLSYDADGILRQKTVLSAVATLVSATGYLTDGQNPTGYAQVLEERVNTAAGTTIKTYAYGSDLISRTVAVASSSPQTAYFLYDGLASVRELTSDSGAVTDTYTYDAFGILTDRSGTSDNPYLYRGERYESDIGQYYLRARFYNQATGRFWNQDSYEGSSSDPTSLHKYLYANANSVMYYDPSGRSGELVSFSATALVVGTLAILAYPQVFEMGMLAARTLIAAGLEGAAQLKEGISGQLIALTLAYEKMKSREKAKVRPLATLRDDPAQKKALIGENMLRVSTAALAFRAETFTPIQFFGSKLPGFPLQSYAEYSIWMWANRAWVRSVMARQLLIIDIGPNITRSFLGWDVSPFYAMEVLETSGYALKIYEPWPPSPIPL